MQNYITEDTLITFGIDLKDHDLESLLSHLNDTVEERVGAEITESLNDQQLQDLIDLQETATDEQIGAWVAERVPDYQQIIQDNIDITIGELAENADTINSAV